MTDTSTEAVEGPQKDTRNMVDVLLETLVGADRVIIETRNALDLMDAHYLHAPTLLRALAAERDALKEREQGRERAVIQGLELAHKEVSDLPEYAQKPWALEAIVVAMMRQSDALTHDDARAALDKMLADAVAQERERCAALVASCTWVCYWGLDGLLVDPLDLADAIRKGET